jgi:glycosyltransferase involved in cell wall biosynthesis
VRNAILRRADAFTAITDGVVEELTSAGVRKEAIHRIPNAVDTNRFSAVGEAGKLSLRENLGVPQGSKVVIYTGRLVSYKGLPLLLRVWLKLRRKHSDIQLFLVGTGGLDIHNCEDELRGFVQDNGLEDSVVFTGSVGNVPEYLQASDLFAFPTENDAFPSSVVEAMACRLPVVSTPVGAISSIVQDGQTGLMVQPGDFGTLYDALDRLLDDQTLAHRLGEAGMKVARDRYSAVAVTQRFQDLFQSLV